MLIRLAELLKENARSQDVVARMGGDEFLIYYIGLTDLKVVKRKASMIQEEFRARMCQKIPGNYGFREYGNLQARPWGKL